MVVIGNCVGEVLLASCCGIGIVRTVVFGSGLAVQIDHFLVDMLIFHEANPVTAARGERRHGEAMIDGGDVKALLLLESTIAWTLKDSDCP